MKSWTNEENVKRDKRFNKIKIVTKKNVDDMVQQKLCKLYCKASFWYTLVCMVNKFESIQ